MSQNIYLSLDNIVSLRIGLNFEKNKINIKDFFQNINPDGFKYISELNLKNLNEEKCKITLIGEDLDTIDEESDISGPVFIIDLKNDLIEFFGPPYRKEKYYKKILDRLNTDGNFILINFCKYCSEEILFNLQTRVIFKIKEDQLLEKIKTFYSKINSTCDGIKTINGKIEGMTINFDKDDYSCSFVIGKIIRDNEKPEFVVILDIINKNQKMKLCDFEIRKHLKEIISTYNDNLNKIMG